MKVDVVLIAYNQEKYIAQAVESVLMQRLNPDVHLRVIVADDCSTDTTLTIIRKYEEISPFSFVYLENQSNLGHVRNYQHAFSMCDGDYVAILEGDDYWTNPLHIQMQINYLHEHLECALTSTTPLLYNENFDLCCYNRTKEFLTIYTTKDFLRYNCITNMSSCVIRNSMLQKLSPKIYNATLLDWILYIALSEYGVLVQLKITTSVYRINSNGYWTKMDIRQQNEYRCKILSEYDDLLNGKYHVEMESSKVLLINKKSFKSIILQYIPPIIIDFVRWILPPLIFEKIKMQVNK